MLSMNSAHQTAVLSNAGCAHFTSVPERWGNATEAVRLLRLAVAVETENTPTAMMNLATVLLAQGPAHTEEAIQMMERVARSSSRLSRVAARFSHLLRVDHEAQRIVTAPVPPEGNVGSSGDKIILELSQRLPLESGEAAAPQLSCVTLLLTY
jgi:hypothetical protein